MQFRSGSREEPEINLIPFIDILLVVLIFLMLTTTYSKYTELQVNLPVADAEQPREYPREIIVSVGQDGRYAVGGQVLESASVEALVRALQQAADGSREPVVIISADAAATHQAVVNVMDAARRTGLNQITFATQQARGR
ncbi:ExbD/TolR family protein [Tepidicella xavieri]|uniref:ExbD/TolR family protein n=1 Tax=Tepidicella xavieri TaxID=360241 RepID=UPI003CCC8681